MTSINLGKVRGNNATINGTNALIINTDESASGLKLIQIDDTATINGAPLLQKAKDYVNTKISDLIGTAPETLDTLEEVAQAIENNSTVIEAINSAIGTKAASTDLAAHTSDTTNPHVVTKAQVGLGNVENKSSETIRNEITAANITKALGYTPATGDTTYSTATDSIAGIVKLYPSIGTNTDGTMTQNAINTELDKKFNTSGGSISGNVSVTGNITVTGNVTADKVYNAVWNADYAEGFDYDGEIPDPGQIIEICGNNKVRIATADSNMIIGVCSNTYWALAGCDIKEIEDKTKVAVGIVGQIPIKINGSVSFGDYIICCGNGIGKAVKEPIAGKVIGRALESNSSEEIKTVNCIIHLY